MYVTGLGILSLSRYAIYKMPAIALQYSMLKISLGIPFFDKGY